MKFYIKVLLGCITVYSFVPAVFGLTKAEQDLSDAVTGITGAVGNQGGNATLPGPRDLEAIKKALAAGANVNTVFTERNNSTALHEVVRVNDTAAVEFLLKNKAKVNAKDADGNTPAHIATDPEKKAILDMLIKNGADLKIKNNNGRTIPEALLMSAVTGVTAAVGNQGGNATVPGPRDLEAIKKALALGANVNTVFTDMNNSTALHEVARVNDTAAVEFLLKNKANVNAKDADGNMPAHKAAEQAEIAILDMLIKNGADLKIKNNNGRTIPEALLMSAVTGVIAAVGNQGGNATVPGPRDLEAIKKALALGANVNTVFTDMNNSTALHEVARVNDTAAVEFLLKNKANINAKDSDGNTPVLIAANLGNEKMIALLQKNGADLKIKNNEGKTVQDLLKASKTQIGNQGGNATVSPMKKLLKVKKPVQVKSK